MMRERMGDTFRALVTLETSALENAKDHSTYPMAAGKILR